MKTGAGLICLSAARPMLRTRSHVRPVRTAPALGVLTALAAAVLTAQTAAAQTPAATILRVRVADSAGVPVPDAEVSVVRGLNEVVVRGTTDAAGRRVLAAPLAAGDYHLVVRKIGMARVDRFFTAGVRDTIAFEVLARRSAQALATVRVIEEEDLRRRSYFIDAEEIARHANRLVDATDVVTRLRPDMIYGRGGGHICRRAVEFVWVNGAQIRLDEIDQGIAYEKRIQQLGYATRVPKDGRRVPRSIVPPKGRSAINAHVLSVLASIRPEHVAEMRGTDCSDFSVGRPSSESAVFVVLKPGVAFEPGKGTFVPKASTAALVEVAPAPAADAAPLAPYRLRIIGVFDDETGKPVEGVEVVDARTGWKVRTTDTGTATLSFLGEGANTVRLVHPAYRAVELPVTIAPADTVPITTTLTRTPSRSPGSAWWRASSCAPLLDTPRAPRQDARHPPEPGDPDAPHPPPSPRARAAPRRGGLRARAAEHDPAAPPP